MFYVSKVSPFLFGVGLLNLLLSVGIKTYSGDIYLSSLIGAYGFLGTILVGAMYQIVPNSQNRKLIIPSASYVSGALIGSFSPLLLLGFTPLALVLYLAGTVLFYIQVLFTIRNWLPITVKFLGVSATYLLLSISLLNLSHFTGAFPFQLAIHTLTVGSMLNAVYGVEMAWIPMLMMETLPIRRATKLFWAKQVSTLIFLGSFYTSNSYLIALGGLAELAVALAFIYLMYTLFKNRRMPSQVPPVIKVFLSAFPFLLGGMIVGLLSANVRYPQILSLHMNLVLFSFVAITVFGGVAHLMPRILWNWIFKEKGFTIADIVSDREINKFLEVALPLMVVFLAVDVAPYPLKLASFFVYLAVVLAFLKITFLSAVKKLTEGKDGKGKEA